MDVYEKICIVCPRGCRLTIKKDENSPRGYTVEGNTCKRGEDYGIKEVTNPTRVLTSTVVLKNSSLKRLPVVTKGDIPKEKMFEAMKVINKVVAYAPINEGDIIIENLLDTGVNLISARSISARY